MKILTLIIAMNVLTFGCSNENMSQTTNVEFIEIAKGFLAGNGAENIPKQNIVINNEADWNNLKTKMNTVNNETGNFIETEIDFSEFIIIAVFDQIYGNGGYSIDVTSISENETNIFVKIENLMTGDSTSVITQPFNIVKIRKVNKQVTFK